MGVAVQNEGLAGTRRCPGGSGVESPLACFWLPVEFDLTNQQAVPSLAADIVPSYSARVRSLVQRSGGTIARHGLGCA